MLPRLSAQSKVSNFHRAQIIYEAVAGLEVSVDEALGVYVFDAASDLREEGEGEGQVDGVVAVCDERSEKH